MISSPTNARIREITALLQKSKERREKDAFVVEGIKMFEETPASLLKEIWVSESFLQKHGVSDKLRQFPFETVTDSVFDRISDTRTPQGILAVVKQMHYSLDNLLSGRPLLLLLEDIQDPGNLGTMIRAGEGAGITGVIMSCNTVDLYNPKTIRSTMGSIFRVPFLYTDNLHDSVRELQKKNVTVYAAHLNGQTAYEDFSYTGAAAFLIGNEGNGLREETTETADFLLKIPMLGKVESLNAGVAASLLVYEAARQRRINL